MKAVYLTLAAVPAECLCRVRSSLRPIRILKKNNGKRLTINPEDRISIYGQESNQTTWRLAKMNLAIRGIDSSNVKWNNEGSFLNDMHKDLKADYVIANPPFNDSDWSGELLFVMKLNFGEYCHQTPKEHLKDPQSCPFYESPRSKLPGICL